MDTFVGAFLERLLATSVQTLVLVVVVWLLVRLLPRLAPATQCWLWWLVALQALAGLIVAPVQLPWLPQTQPAAALVIAAPGSFPIAAASMVHRSDVPTWQLALVLVWMAGIAVMSWATMRQLHRVRQLLGGSSPCTDEVLITALARACAEQRIRRAPAMRQSDLIDSPALVGHLRPVLLLPARLVLNATELHMTLAHELAHLRRGDLWWGFIPALARHLFFFHPCVHLALREYALAREADCDATVVATERFSRREYGDLLLRLGANPGADRGVAVASPTYHSLRRRLTMLQKTSFLPRAGALAILAVVAGTGVLPLRLVVAAAAPNPAAVTTPAAATSSAAPAASPARSGITSIDFNRSSDGSAAGRVIIGLADPRTPVTVTRQDNRIIVDLGGAELPAELHRHFDVTDFATAVTGINAVSTSSGAQLEISTSGEFNHRTDLTGNKYVVEIRPRGPVSQRAEPAPQRTGPAPVYTGARMSGRFEEIPTRVLLQLITETGGGKIIVDDSVGGTVTLSVENMPWDQLLDTVLRVKGLGMRQQGDTMFVATAEVIDRSK